MRFYHHNVGDFERSGTKISDLPTVYIITTPDFEFIKVGQSKALKDRMSNIQSGCPFDLSVWIVIRTPKPTQVEQDIHSMLVHCSVRGEWFAPSHSDLDFLIEYWAATNLSVRKARDALPKFANPTESDKARQ